MSDYVEPNDSFIYMVDPSEREFDDIVLPDAPAMADNLVLTSELPAPPSTSEMVVDTSVHLEFSQDNNNNNNNNNNSNEPAVVDTVYMQPVFHINHTDGLSLPGGITSQLSEPEMDGVTVNLSRSIARLQNNMPVDPAVPGLPMMMPVGTRLIQEVTYVYDDMPDMPDMPDMSAMPELPPFASQLITEVRLEIPATSDMPDMLDMPDMPDSFDMFGPPDMLDQPVMPELPLAMPDMLDLPMDMAATAGGLVTGTVGPQAPAFDSFDVEQAFSDFIVESSLGDTMSDQASEAETVHDVDVNDGDREAVHHVYDAAQGAQDAQAIREAEAVQAPTPSAPASQNGRSMQDEGLRLIQLFMYYSQFFYIEGLDDEASEAGEAGEPAPSPAPTRSMTHQDEELAEDAQAEARRHEHM